MKIVFAVILSLFLVYPAIAAENEKSADSLIEEAENALLQRNYALAIKLIKESASLVKSQTQTAYRYELAMRLAYLEASSETFYNTIESWRSEDWGKINDNFADFAIYFKEYASLLETAGTSGNPLEPRVLVYEMKAVKKLHESIEEIERNEWPMAAVLSAIADFEIGAALFEFIGSKMNIRPEPSVPTVPKRKEIS
jgi:hypothetical protein